MNKNNRNNEQIYGRNDMIMLDLNNKIYGSLGIADNYVMKTEEGTRLILSNPKLGRFGDVLTEFNIYGRSSQFTTTGKNLAHGKNEKYYINTSVNLCGFNNNDIGMAIDVSNLTNVTISTRSIQYRYRIGCVDTVPTNAKTVTCYNGRNKDGTKDSYTIDTTDYNYLIVNATKLEDIQVEKGSEATSYEPYTGGIPSPSPDYPQEIKSVVNPIVKVTNEDGTKSQTVTLQYTLNAIPVTSGGNVTIDGKQYIADYVDVERGKLVRMCKEIDFTKVKQSSYSNLLTNTKEARYSYDDNNIKPLRGSVTYNTGSGFITRAMLIGRSTWNNDTLAIAAHGQAYGKQLSIRIPVNKDAIEYFTSIGGCKGIFQIETPEEIDLMPEQIQAYKSLSTNYPVTIIENNYNTWMKATYKSTESV